DQTSSRKRLGGSGKRRSRWGRTVGPGAWPCAPLLSSAGTPDQVLSQICPRFVTGGLARLEGFEPPTNGFGSHYSIRLSYRRVSKGLFLQTGPKLSSGPVTL